MEQETEPRRLLDVAEVARRLSLHKRTVYNQLSRKKFPLRPKRLGRRPLFDSYEVEAFIRDLPHD